MAKTMTDGGSSKPRKMGPSVKNPRPPKTFEKAKKKRKPTYEYFGNAEDIKNGTIRGRRSN